MTKKFAIYDDITKRLEALDPGDATGLPIPAFTSGPALPAVGTISGEAFLNTTSNTAFVWNGAQWNPIVPSALLTYPDDTSVLTDSTQPAGSYAASEATGNLFVRSNTDWHQVGIRTYPTAVGLLADAPPDGSLSVALDENTFWLRNGGTWLCQTVRPFANVAAMVAWQPPDGAQALTLDDTTFWYRTGGTWTAKTTRLMADNAAVLAWGASDGSEAVTRDTGIHYVRVLGAWYPKTLWLATEAGVLANHSFTAGQLAVATDTGRIFTYDGTNWIGSPFRSYPTEVALLADTPADGNMAVAVDTGTVYFRAAGVWRSVNKNAMPTGTTDPVAAASTAGDMFFNTTSTIAKIYSGTAWLPMGVSHLDGLTDVDVSTRAPVNGDVLKYSISDLAFTPQQIPPAVFTVEPAVGLRRTGDLWWSGSRMYTWAAEKVWVQV